MPAAASGRKRGIRKWQQGRNKSRGHIPVQTACRLCKFEAEDSYEFEVHKNEERHVYNWLLEKFKSKRKRIAKDRHNVIIQTWCEEKHIEFTDDGTVKTVIEPTKEELEYEFKVINEKKDSPLVILKVMLLHPYKAFSITDEHGVTRESCHVSLDPGSCYSVKVKFVNCDIGTYGVPVAFVLDRKGLREKETPFFIVRLMVVNVLDSRYTKQEVVSCTESPFTGEEWKGMEVTYQGTMPDGRRIQRLLEFNIPADLLILLKNEMVPFEGMEFQQLEMLRDLLKMFDSPFPLDIEKYVKFFHTLLYMDEYEAMVQVEMYNMADVVLKIMNDTCLELEVPGLAERRPSVLKGDLIYLRVSFGKDQVEKIQYEGVVSEVRDTCIWISGFHPAFWDRISENPELHFDVHFTVSRFTYYVMHRSLDLMLHADRFGIIFPEDEKYPCLPVTGDIKFFNRLIEENPEQETAVRNILKGTSRPAPYIIHGPPGTGKTMTVVEAILQIKKKIKDSHILVCAPANAACDLLAEKLIQHCTTKELLRLHSSSRDWSTVPSDLYPYSNRDEFGYYLPKADQLKKYRIIVCTLIKAGHLLPKPDINDDFADVLLHFTHVFIDECGQAMEPATLVPIAGILTKVSKKYPGGQVVLAGDPKQLGPVCSSRMAEKFGLGMSLMERLMGSYYLYARDELQGELYDNRFITKLCRNFRSHEEILHLPNQLFYHGDLIAKCSSDVTDDPVKNLVRSPKLNKAIIFHGVLGQEKREGRSPSYFNNYEMIKVVSYVATLLEDAPNRKAIRPDEIGVIAPYIRQVYKLKARLKELGWEEVEVGTTETFQGREKRVIIISTVRSNRNLLDHDSKYSLGFLNNEKRFNVAITRARSLLIIVGNPHLLEVDENWGQLLYYTQNVLGSYRGCIFTSRLKPEWTDYVINKMKSLALIEEKA